ncbi:uncharacterized protein F4822DRAFT_286738 [Hypoxylon trugodes]|uniref:uncharacterized protein n=1 Tax=Hypoxylon trugodes TaxID=326681 RepID=UPI002194495E|nr:uncharacterized protein F4822DRAFT_286738 [Hypoxylon trugodes]KAI1387566.1 hypothetical protein F4822DRAFT_286738 [Hypoxylon trugodes]
MLTDRHRCANCQYKNYNMCAGVILSTLQKYYVVPSVYCHALPASVDAEDGALVALVALALRICQVAELQARQNVLVLGSNSIGILTQMIANMQGARVIGVDTSHWRTSFASGSSAHGVCVPKWSSTSTTDSASPPPEVVDQIVHQFRLGDGADVVVDCTGSESYIKTGVFAAKRGGTYVQATVVDPFVELPIVMAQEKALNIKGSVRDIADCYPSAIDLVASGRITPRILVMNRFEADEAEEAFEEVNENREYSMKVMIKGIP